MEPVIIIPAFSRAMSLKRLLNSLNNATYGKNNVKIIISLDGGYSSGVLSVADDFKNNFKKGTVEIVKRENNIGLRNHIIWCGEQTKKYNSIIVLEDDLIVSKSFYHYAIAQLKFHNDDDVIAGISLYSQKFNEYANLPFEANYYGYDNYFMQMACSWGQAWTNKQWELFKKWYDNVDDEYLLLLDKLPEQVKKWSDKSWKKYYSAYLIDMNKFFSYPHVSQTSNCADDGGTHIQSETSVYQVSIDLFTDFFCVYKFQKYSNSIIRYDSFMEVVLPDGYFYMGIDSSDITIDFYGLKSISLIKNKTYVITSKNIRHHEFIVPLKYKPIENNLLISEVATNKTGIVLAKSCDVENDDFCYFRLARYFSYFRLITKKMIFSSLFSCFRV